MYLANAGGLLGLCVGFSMLSLLEALYYVSLRVYCRHNREKTMESLEQSNSTVKLDIQSFYPSGNAMKPIQWKHHMECVNKIFYPAYGESIYTQNRPTCMP